MVYYSKLIEKFNSIRQNIIKPVKFYNTGATVKSSPSGII
ncbi:hypothetical protein LBBP_03088 [Leptospira borgpetersenii serovar Ballum]|uniref:Uncharacterized protein n=1 Tax=Leptospira borgpetersenii serovar Ballum TaxID=280505 RepID=A0A0S2IUY2_LEPBO|nr:hypothetical protein LBBP_03088 [Leptospira borgpetersenii serovar Ballum]